MRAGLDAIASVRAQDSMNQHRDSEDESRPPKRRRQQNNNAEHSDGGSEKQNAEEGPACHACRKKKTKCSRQQPCGICVQSNTECSYSTMKAKPGIPTGAVGNLSQRLGTLENMFLGQSVLWQQVWSKLSELEKLVIKDQNASCTRLDKGLSPEMDLEACKNMFLQAVRGTSDKANVDSTRNRPLPSKSPEPEGIGKCDDKTSTTTSHREFDTYLPADGVLRQLVDIYFTHIHPWIPILHIMHFRGRFDCPAERESIEIILYAILSVTVKFSDHHDFEDHDTRVRLIKLSREKVILKSVECFSVENLQALIIIAFDTVGNGRGPASWSIVGSMARTVEQLQLNVEDEEESNEKASESVAFLIRRMAFLPPPETWLLKEEQRRIFWAIFLLDRFCSIATGWNLSLTSADVRRRLPCERAFWEEGLQLRIPAPYFGDVEKDMQSLNEPSPFQSSMPGRSPTQGKNPASIGGFAYRIEATETLSLVTMFFLKYPVNFSSVQDVQMWMMRFKELDLRLVQWKLFLPEKWRKTSVFTEKGVMDQNLSMAHIMHNTAVILLHQGIAYPSVQWRNSPVRLPSVSSAETCLAAAAEISNIAQQFLIYSPRTSPVAPDFAFSLFVTGRMLLAHAFHYNTALPDHFDRLMNSLAEISRRWDGLYGSEDGNLASKFATRLTEAREIGHAAAAASQPSLDLQHPVYSEREHDSIAHKRAHGISNLGNSSGPGLAGLDGAQNGGQENSLRGHNLAPNAASFSLAGLDASQVQRQTLPAIDLSLAFPALPYTSQFEWPQYDGMHSQKSLSLSVDRSNPQPSGAPSFSEQEFQGHSNSSGADGIDNSLGFDTSGQDFDDLNEFFKSSYLPIQRISTFLALDE